MIILVALDESPRARSVLETAFEVARRFGSTLVLFRAVELPQEFPPGAATHHEDQLPAHLGHIAHLQLQEFASRAPDLAISCRVEATSQAWRAILGASDELEIDLIVIGSHGFSGIDHILGTTAGQVANLAHMNVLVVHTRTAQDDVVRDPRGVRLI